MKMKIGFSIISFLLAGSLIDAADIATTLKNNPNLSKVAALNRPQWAQTGPFTVIVPSDIVITDEVQKRDPKLLGHMTINDQVATGQAWHYKIISDVTENQKVVWDNYDTSTIDADGTIHIRYGTGESLNTKTIRADNGIIIVIDKPLDILQTPSNVFQAHPELSGFADLIAKAGMKDGIDLLQDYTILAPENGALADANTGSFTTAQLQNIIKYHLIPKARFTTTLVSGNWATMNGQAVAVAIASEGITYNGKMAHNTLGDILSLSGVIVQISGLLRPADINLNSTGSLPVPVPVPVPSPPPTSTDTKASTTTKTSNSIRTEINIILKTAFAASVVALVAFLP